MNVKDFVHGYKNARDKQKFVEQIITKHYLSYAMKIAEADQIIKYTSYNTDGKYYVNSPLRYCVFIQSVLRNYTALEFDEDNVMEGFDLLEESGATDDILNGIGIDVSRFQTVLNMKLDDITENERALVPYIEGKLEALGVLLDQFAAAYEQQQASE